MGRLLQGAYMQLQSFFSMLQMIGSLFIGMLIDKIGSKGVTKMSTLRITFIVMPT